MIVFTRIVHTQERRQAIETNELALCARALPFAKRVLEDGPVGPFSCAKRELVGGDLRRFSSGGISSNSQVQAHENKVLGLRLHVVSS